MIEKWPSDEVLTEEAWDEILKDAESALEDWTNESGDFSDEAFSQLTSRMWEILRDPGAFRNFL